MSATANTYPQILLSGLQASYDALETKDTNKLYFCTDTGKLYKGSVDFTSAVIKTASKPEHPVVGKLYLLTGTGTVEAYDGTAWNVISYPVDTVIDASSDDVHVATAKAVYDAVQGAISGDGVVNAVASSQTSGNISVTTNGTTSNVPVNGVVTTPSYAAATRTFTFPVVGGESVVVELGKDIFIDPEGNNRYENGNIYLYLNDGVEGHEATELVIPVTSLVTDYFGGDTDSITVDIDGTTHEVTATANIRPDVAGSFTNALKLSTTSGAKGLYVDLSSYYTSSETDSAISAAIADLDATVTQTAGADGLSLSVTEVDGVITGVSGSIAANTYDAHGAAAAVQGDTTTTVEQNEVNIAALATAATTWGTF